MRRRFEGAPSYTVTELVNVQVQLERESRCEESASLFEVVSPWVYKNESASLRRKLLELISKENNIAIDILVSAPALAPWLDLSALTLSDRLRSDASDSAFMDAAMLMNNFAACLMRINR